MIGPVNAVDRGAGQNASHDDRADDSAGLLLSSQFNINYFAISEVDQWFEEFVQEWVQAGMAYFDPILAIIRA